MADAAAMRTLLLVGPVPPPIGGSPLAVQAMLTALGRYPDVRVTVISTSPALDVRKKMTGFNPEKVARSLSIVPRFLREARRHDAILVFANDLFAITLVPVLLAAARLFRKPFFLKPVGAGLDLYIKARSRPLREFLLYVLRTTDGVRGPDAPSPGGADEAGLPEDPLSAGLPAVAAGRSGERRRPGRASAHLPRPYHPA